MADSEAFDFVCEHLERNTALDRLAARGTVRIALKQGGLEARNVTPEQMTVVTEKILPRELESRGVQDSESVCATIGRGLAVMESGAGGTESPDVVFERLGGAGSR